MRLSPSARQIIVQSTREVFGTDARAILFGSRTDDTQRGGDIDLLIELARPDPLSGRKSLTLAALLQQRLGDQPIDVLVTDPATPLQPIHRVAKEHGIPL
jgi:predicted nucleotidyltransferase